MTRVLLLFLFVTACTDVPDLATSEQAAIIDANCYALGDKLSICCAQYSYGDGHGVTVCGDSYGRTTVILYNEQGETSTPPPDEEVQLNLPGHGVVDARCWAEVCTFTERGRLYAYFTDINETVDVMAGSPKVGEPPWVPLSSQTLEQHTDESMIALFSYCSGNEMCTYYISNDWSVADIVCRPSTYCWLMNETSLSTTSLITTSDETAIWAECITVPGYGTTCCAHDGPCSYCGSSDGGAEIVCW